MPNQGAIALTVEMFIFLQLFQYFQMQMGFALQT